VQNANKRVRKFIFPLEIQYLFIIPLEAGEVLLSFEDISEMKDFKENN
jgi:hypothetical protein